jgi:hypothetical protein
MEIDRSGSIRTIVSWALIEAAGLLPRWHVLYSADPRNRGDIYVRANAGSARLRRGLRAMM